MSINIGTPKIINDSISFYVDFSNKKSFSPNLLNYSNWSVGSASISTNTNLYGASGWVASSANIYGLIEDQRILSSNPFGYTSSVVWTASDLDTMIEQPEALTFIQAAGITHSYQKDALHELVASIKRLGVWNSMKAIYPFVGGSADSHKINLVNPQTFTLSFSGGITHSLYGVYPNGIDAYAKTGINPKVHLINNLHLSFYSRTSGTGPYTESTSIGAYEGPTNSISISTRRASNSNISGISSDYVYFTLPDHNLPNSIAATNSDGRYYYSINRTGSLLWGYKVTPSLSTAYVYEQYRNDISTTNGGLPNSELLLFANGDSNGNPIANTFDNHECSFVTIGNYLNADQNLTLSYYIETFFKRLTVGSGLDRSFNKNYPYDWHGRDGGWDSGQFTIDNSKLYRFSVWSKRNTLVTGPSTDPNGGSSFYLGTRGISENGNLSLNESIVTNNAGVTNSNPYFYAYSAPFDNLDWNLVVGHVWPRNNKLTLTHFDTGVWRKDFTKVQRTLTDYKWNVQTKRSLHRSYIYYSSNPGITQSWIYPRVDLCDGYEPSIKELIEGVEPIRDISKNSNKIYAYNVTNFSNKLNSLIFTSKDNAIGGSLINKFSAKSVSIWFEPQNTITTSSNSITLFNFRTSNKSYHLRLGSFTNGLDNEVISFISKDFNSGDQLITAVNNMSLTASNWYNVVLNWEDDKYSIYLNTEKMNTISTTNGNANLMENISYVCIGAYYSISGQDQVDDILSPFIGRIGSIITYNRKLSTDEIIFNYNNTLNKYFKK